MLSSSPQWGYCKVCSKRPFIYKAYRMMLLEGLVLLSAKDSSFCSSKFLSVLHTQHENLSFGLRRN